MTFISYAQNCEDVILYRALRNVDKGFYIDVGAYDPVIDSVTKAFYERGWRGINIEPVKKWFERLVEDRPEDINLQIVINNEPGVVRLYEVVDTGLSTLVPEVAEKHRQAGFQIQEYFVPALTLNSVYDSYSVGEIHFLKIDVEGAEAAVLASIDLERIRPWIILVEATEPNSTVENFMAWESYLTGHRYEFVYFDGLNRFYIAKERQDLRSAFHAPPNVFDGFIRYNEWLACQKTVQLEEEISNSYQKAGQLQEELDSFRRRVALLEQELNSSRGHIVRLTEQLDNFSQQVSRLEEELRNSRQYAARLEEELKAVYASRSWRITMPVRKAMDILKACYRHCPALAGRLLGLPKRLFRAVVRRAGLWVLSHPRLAAVIKRRLLRYPLLVSWLKRTVQHKADAERVVDSIYPISYDPSHLPGHAAQVYADLSRAFAASRRS